MPIRESILSSRSRGFDSSGIRRVFELAAKLKNPVNLSIGQPDFPVPVEVQEACIQAIREGRNGYSLTQGIQALRDALEDQIQQEYPETQRQVLITSGTSGALVLAILAVIEPDDEVILFDPYFVMYRPLVELVGGRAVVIDTYPDFRIDPLQVRSHITSRTKAIIFNSPANPTGRVAPEEEVRDLAQLAGEHDILLISDEIYRVFCYDGPFHSPAQYNPETLVIDGFSKSHAMTGWRLGYAHGPSVVVETMTKLQQYSFVCAPHPVQWAGLAALNFDVSPYVAAYRQKRDRLVQGLQSRYEFAPPGGAFYLFAQSPRGPGSEFALRAAEQGLLVVPGNNFSQRDTHFRISYAADDATIDRGVEILLELAR